MNNSLQVLNGFGSNMNKMDDKNRFHDIVFVLRYKYVPVHKKAVAILGEQTKNVGELKEQMDESAKFTGHKKSGIVPLYIRECDFLFHQFYKIVKQVP